MNARGERILVFGDSLTEHAGSVPVWSVDQGPQRQSFGPGDLFASMLLDQGATVRVNAKSGRSAVNFWANEPAAQLIAADLAFQPTKIVFVLGTNDVGLATGPDEAAFRRLVAAYKPSGAEMWSIGPFTNRQDKAAQEAVAGTLRRVFGRRFLDGRPISVMISPGGDGIHYDSRGARALALNMTDALLSASVVKSWVGLAIGVAIVAGSALAWTHLSQRRRGLAGVEIVDGKRWGGSTSELVRGGYRQIPCKSGLDAKGLARCWSRGLGAADADDDDPRPGEDDETWWQRLLRQADARNERMRKALAQHDALILTTSAGRRVLVIKTPEMSNPDEGSLRVTTFDEDGPIGHTTRADVAKLAEEVQRDWHPKMIKPASAAEVDAWMSTERFARGSAAVLEVQKANRRGLSAADQKDPAKTFRELIRSDDPEAMGVAEDLILEQGWKLREITGGMRARHFTIELKPMWGPSAEWKMVQTHIDATSIRIGPAGSGKYIPIRYSVANGAVRIELKEDMQNMSPDDARKAAVATGWAIAKAIKPLPLNTDEATIRRVAQEAIDNGPDNLKREELFGARGLGLPAAEREALARVVVDYKDVAKRRRYDEPDRAASSCDIATPDFVRRAAEAGVALKPFRFDLTNKADLRRVAKLYAMTPKETAAVRRQVDQTAPDMRDCMFHEVAVTDDGMAIDWTANQFKRAPLPFVFHLNPIDLSGAQLPPGATFHVARAAAAVPRAERFGDRKAFIVDVHRQLRANGVDISLEDLKQELIRMQHDHNVKLARADLVAAMDRKKVAASETKADGAAFHFVVVE